MLLRCLVRPRLFRAASLPCWWGFCLELASWQAFGRSRVGWAEHMNSRFLQDPSPVVLRPAASPLDAAPASSTPAELTHFAEDPLLRRRLNSKGACVPMAVELSPELAVLACASIKQVRRREAAGQPMPSSPEAAYWFVQRLSRGQEAPRIPQNVPATQCVGWCAAPCELGDACAAFGRRGPGPARCLRPVLAGMRNRLHRRHMCNLCHSGRS